jgi:hypothetical protein
MRTPACLVIALCSILFMGAGCVHTTQGNPVPDGFARYTDAQETRAVSPEGVTYRVRSEANKPYADLPFWKEALKKRMLDAGYLFLREAPVTADNREGYLLELIAPFGQQDDTYLMAVFALEKKIVIVEAAGEVNQLAARRKAIIAAIGRLKF